MDLRRLTVLLPCHSLDDFPTYLRGQEATSILAGWTALWHPALIAACRELPQWRRADDPPDPDALRGELVVVPTSARRCLPQGWLDRFAATSPNNPPPLDSYGSREDLIASLAQADVIPGNHKPDPGDFFALGYCVLQVELLARAMHYPHVLDESQLKVLVVDAALAAVAGTADEAHEKLGAAFDLLTQARQHFYPVDCFLIDITLIAPTTWGPPLRQELATSVEGAMESGTAGTATNVLANGAQVEQLARDEPDTLAALRDALDRGTATVIGGPYDDLLPRWMSPERLLEVFTRGAAAYQRQLGRPVNVFAQFHSDTTPLVPQVLRELGFAGALLTTFDGYAAPAKDQSRCEWTAADGTSLDAMWLTPLDTANDDTFLSVSERLYQTMQHDHVATLLMAGWSGQRSDFYGDWRRSARYAPVLGSFLTLDDYFSQSAQPEYWVSPQVTMPVRTTAEGDRRALARARSDYAADLGGVHDQLLTGLAHVLRDSPSNDLAEISPADALGAIRRLVSGDDADPPQEEVRMLAVNALSQPRRIVTDVQPFTTAAADPDPVPGLGFRWLRAAKPLPAAIAEETRLCNEHVEVLISPATGGIQSFKSHRDRRTRVSQRLVVVANPRREHQTIDIAPAGSSRMELDRWEIAQNNEVRGVVATWGRLLVDEDRCAARFQQRVSLERGATHLLVEGQLELAEGLPDERRAYVASRLLWSEPAVALASGLNWLRQPVTNSRIVASDWVEIARPDGQRTVTLYPLGPAEHVVMGDRALDTLLTAGGDEPLTYRFAVGLDEPHPLETLFGLLTPAERSVTKAKHFGGPDSGWFLTVRPQHVVVTHLARLQQPSPGMVVRLLETEGRAANVNIAAWRKLAGGQRTDFRGQTLESLLTRDGQVLLEVGPYQWIQLQLFWS